MIKTTNNQSQAVRSRRAVMALVLAVFLIIQMCIPTFYATAADEETPGRIVEDIGAGWQFSVSQTDSSNKSAAVFDDSGWETVDIPHCWNNLDGQNGGNNYLRGMAWYRKHVQWQPEYVGKKLYIEVLAANMQADVYVNGVFLGNHKGGYTAFRYDITDVMLTGDNVVAIMVDNRYTTAIAPLSGDFTVYGGMYRGVSIVATDPVHVDLLDNGAKGLYLSTPSVTDEQAELGIRSKILNDSNTPKEVSVTAVLRMPDTFDANPYIPTPLFNEAEMAPGGPPIKTVEKTITIEPGGSYVFDEKITVNNPRLWDGMEDPFRYQVDLTVSAGGTIVDEFSDFVGFRYFHVDKNDGFFLNGRSYPLRGVNRHQDRENKGNAISKDDQDEDLSLIYEVGANTVRLAHYPHSSYFYELCDSYGIVVWAEIPLVNAVPTDSNAQLFRETTKGQLREMILQHYNHPAIMFWGLQNEVGTTGSSSGMVTLMQELDDLAHELDPSRLTTQAANRSEAETWACDIIAWNIYPGWYGGGTVGGMMDGHKGHYRALGISEYGVGVNPYQHAENPSQPSSGGQWHPEEYGNKLHENALKDISTRDYLWGTFLWNMFDFGADHRNEGSNPGINDKGLVTHDRSLKKDGFYVYKANWNKTDLFSYITSRRWDLRENPVTTVKIYSNCDSVNLTLNGVDLGTKLNNGYGIFEWPDTILHNGENVLVSTGTKDGADGEFTDTVTWNKVKSPSAGLESDTLFVDNTERTIALTAKVLSEDLQDVLRGAMGSTYILYEADGETEVTSGEVLPGMKVFVTSENGEATAVYTFKVAHIAAGKTLTASSQEAENPVSSANDFNSSTRWAASSSSYPQWVTIDLGDVYSLDDIAITWYNVAAGNRAYRYEVQTSRTNSDFVTMVDRKSNTQPNRVSDSLDHTWGRYVRIYVSGSNGGNASLYEIEINGWSLSSDAYEIDHVNRIISVPALLPGYVLADEIFLGNLNIGGNGTYRIEGENHAYYVVDGEFLVITDSQGIEHRYYIRLGADPGETAKVISVGRDVYFSGEEGVAGTPGAETTTAKNINDGDIATRWAAPKRLNNSQGVLTFFQYPEWVIIDLGAVYDLSEVEIFLFRYGQNSRSYRYEVLASASDMEDESFVQIVDATANTDKNGHFVHPVSGVGRYIKVNVVGSSDYDNNPNASYAAASVYELTVKGTEVQGQDSFALLQERITQADAMEEVLYTPESWAGFSQALTAAKAISAVETSALIDAAREALEAAIEALEEIAVVDKTALLALVEEVDNLDEALYTVESWEAMQKVLADAKVVAGDANATQNDVSAMEEDLRQAVADLNVVAGIPVESITIEQGALTNLSRGKTLQLSVTIAPENATDQTITWSSSNSNILTVSEDGEVMAIKAGMARVVATAPNGLTSTVTIRVQ